MSKERGTRETMIVFYGVQTREQPNYCKQASRIKLQQQLIIIQNGAHNKNNRYMSDHTTKSTT